MSTKGKPYPALGHLLGAYFHQDWQLDDPDPGAVVDRFLRDEPPERAQEVVRDIDQVLRANLAPAKLEELLARDLGSAYYPPADGKTWADWLRGLRDRLAQGAKKKP